MATKKTATAKKRKSKVWKNVHLRDVFDLYNDRYFGGKLKVCDLRFRRLDILGQTIRHRIPGKPRDDEHDAFGIHINSRFRDSRRLWATTLLHEMVHLEQKNRYSCGINGHTFNNRMKELAAQGAFNGIW